MFAAFALSDEGNNFLRNKPDNKDPEKLKRILKDLLELKNQSVASLLYLSKGLEPETADQLLNLHGNLQSDGGSNSFIV